MRTHVDWLTFTMKPRYGTRGDYEEALQNAFIDKFGVELTKQVFGGAWMVRERSRAPYADAWTMPEAGITLFAGLTIPHCCIEISGEGCERLIRDNLMQAVLDIVAENCTRIDIACDIATDVTPIAFTENTAHERMRASGYQRSETGETCYVGSMKSDRYARVYRYFEPHPRSKLLRVEHVFRKEYARSVARASAQDIDAVANSAGKAFGWKHQVWDTGKSGDIDISVNSKGRTQNNTLSWIVKSCAPAVRRLITDGTIVNPDEFFTRYFLPED